MNQLGGGDDCLLFRQTDFVDPLHSAAFSALEHHESTEINALARFVRAQLKNDLALIPALQIPVPAVTVALEPLSSTVEPVRSGPRLVRGTLPAWLRDDHVTPARTLAPADHNSDDSDQDTAPHTVQPSWAVPIKPAAAAQWIKPTVEPTVAYTTSELQTNSATTLQVSGAIPPELLISPPRTVAFNEACDKKRPEHWQKLMIFCPFLWIMVYASYMAIGPDNDLRTKGVDYSATVTGFVKPFYSIGQQTVLSLIYNVNGVSYTTDSELVDSGVYKRGDRCGFIHALPMNPTIHEAADAQPGAKQRGDIFLAMLCLSINLLLEAMIWIPGIRHRDLARFGLAVLARVDTLRMDAGPRGQKDHMAVVSFLMPANTYPTKRQVRISESEYLQLTAGSTEVMLYRSNNLNEELVFYRFYSYRVVP
jgi:hypothetical protein